MLIEIQLTPPEDFDRLPKEVRGMPIMANVVAIRDALWPKTDENVVIRVVRLTVEVGERSGEGGEDGSR